MVGKGYRNLIKIYSVTFLRHKLDVIDYYDYSFYLKREGRLYNILIYCKIIFINYI